MTSQNSATRTPRDALADARPVRELLLRALEDRWPKGDERLHELSRYALLPAGKLLRPLLLVESARAVGGGHEAFLPAALGVEYLHVGSLIHDDVIDGDTLRRGRRTVAARYGLADAVVAGDALIMNMFAAIAECADHGMPTGRLLEAVRILARAGVDLCRGQVMEAEPRGDDEDGLDRYLTMIALKTGALFRGACHGGAVLGGGSAAQRGALIRYAEHLGLAFQMHDDLLPYLSDPSLTGKSGLSDLVNGRPTFPVLLARQRATPAQRRELDRALDGDPPATEAHRVVGDLLVATGALTTGTEHAAAQAALAKECLNELPGSASSAVLAAVADFSVERER